MPDKTTFSPAVITSRKASDDLDHIKIQHADILGGMQNQAIKLATLNQQKAAEAANQQAVRAETDKAMLTANTEVQKISMQNDLKREELAIKRAALSAV